MLNRLTIRNLVIVRELELAFGGGMSALTGETGAGKSIMIDALGLALGDRTDKGMIRAGCDKAEVSAEFDLADCPAALQWLQERDLADATLCLLRRVLVREGRSRAYINGSPVPQGSLRELGELLLNIHGQHAHQSLLRNTAQRALLDAYGALQPLAAELGTRYQALSAAIRQREELAQAAADRANRIDYLEFQVGELQPLLDAAQDIAGMEAEHRRLAHAEKLQTESSALLFALDESEHNIASALASLGQQLADLAELDDKLAEARDLLEAAGIQVDEATQSLRHYADGIEVDPQQLQTVDEQIGRLHDAARKHRVDIEALPELAATLQAELDSLRNADQQLDALDAQVARLQQTYDGQAAALSEARAKAAARLSGTVTASMQELGMAGGTFEVRCDPDPAKPSRHGIDRVDFQVAANPGQPAGPLSAVASGGELSRIALAIQVATADCGEVPSLIFDEVDVGIGGAVAEIVGQLLRRLGVQRQVLCVTHLPQVAAQAHRHYRVHKMRDAQSTETRIEPLDEQGRIGEIARMLGGVDITEQTRRHAGEMIERAQHAG
jgi:DNA repair protein RecN (Recombination protein N)